jgi:hypothetical protein
LEQTKEKRTKTAENTLSRSVSPFLSFNAHLRLKSLRSTYTHTHTQKLKHENDSGIQKSLYSLEPSLASCRPLPAVPFVSIIRIPAPDHGRPAEPDRLSQQP